MSDSVSHVCYFGKYKGPDLLQPCKLHLKASTHSYRFPLLCFDCPANALVKRFQDGFYCRGCPLARGYGFHQVSRYWCMVAVLTAFRLGARPLSTFPFLFSQNFLFPPTAVFKQENKQFPKALRDASAKRCAVMMRALCSITSHKW